MELKRQEVKLFSKSSHDVKNLYLSAFPAVERAPYLPLLLTSYRDLADFYAYYDGDDFVGLAYILQNEAVVYLFFLAVMRKMVFTLQPIITTKVVRLIK